MGLNPRGRGRGGKGRRGGGGMGGGPNPMFRGPPGMCGPPPMGFPPGPPPFGPPFFGGPCGSNFGPRRPPGYGKFPRKNFKGRNQPRNQNAQDNGMDLTKPWVTDEIRAEEQKKQECLETWRKTKDDTDWSKYKEQKLLVQNLYNKAKAEYNANKQDEAPSWFVPNSARENVYCEACDRSFRDERELYLHQSEHETCGRDGCAYSAHPKLVAKHVKMQHDTGLYKRIGRLNTEEDIAKWVEERKRKYPTRKVVEEKKAMEEEKVKRGERINEDNKKFNKSFSKRRERQKVKTFKKKSVKDKKSYLKMKKEWEDGPTVEEALKEESSWRGSVPPFNGIRTSTEETAEKKKPDDNFTDDEWEGTIHRNETKSVSNSLGILAACYDSALSEDGEEDAPEEVKTISVKENCVPNGAETKKRELRDRKCRRRCKRRKTEEGESENVRAEVVRIPRKRELTLLEKLLSKEIRHERNVILQCVRYVVQNNFFDDNRNKTSN